MKSAASILGTPRRMFLAVVVLLVLVLAWNLSKEWRTGIHEHRLGHYTVLKTITVGSTSLYLGTNQLWWYNNKEGSGTLMIANNSAAQWDVAAYAGSDISAVKPQDGRVDFFGAGPSGHRAFGASWGTNELVVHDGQIVLLRHGADRQTIYALQVVEQRNGAGYFRSRKILPAPAGK